MLLQIHEPGQTPLPHEHDNSAAVGIDLGTTNSLIAIVKDGLPHIIKDKNGSALQPSVVSYLSGNIIVGNEALNQKGAIKSIKRLMGRGSNDIKKISGRLPYNIIENNEGGMVRLNIEGKAVSPIEISAEILKHLKRIAEKELDSEINRAVITVPAYFDDAARAATKDAAKLAGLNVLRLVNEPTAAALAYGLDKNSEGIYAVYDLGGGTFDISILKMEKGVFQVLSTGGSTAIGGDDFDHKLAEIFLWKYKNETGDTESLTTEDLNILLSGCRKIKEQLSTDKEGEFTLIVKGKEHKFTLSRAEFNNDINPYVDATVEICRQAIDDAAINISDIKGVVLVGGSTRVPLVREKVAEFFGREPLSDINPDEIVAYGAALQAEGLTKGSDNLLLDVLPLSLGIETVGGIVEKIIYRNTPIPVARAQEFTTYKDGQTAIMIHVTQGEREIAAQNRSLAKFELKGIPPMTAGAARVKVTFTVDADGLLNVSADEETTGIRQDVEVKPSYGLSEQEIKQMLLDSMAFAKDDMEKRLLTESKVESESLINALRAALKQDGSILEYGELEQIEQIMTELSEVIKNNNRNDINNKKQELENISRSFAERRMNKYISAALEGKKV